MLQWLELKIIFICLKLRVKLRFYGFLSDFGSFAHKVAQNWFVLHKILHTTLFGIYYCVELVRIENNIHMLEITYKVVILWVLKRFWHFCA